MCDNIDTLDAYTSFIYILLQYIYMGKNVLKVYLTRAGLRDDYCLKTLGKDTQLVGQQNF